MPDPDTADPSAPPLPAPPAHSPHPLEAAFPAADASDEELQQLEQVPPDLHLLEAALPPPAIDFDQLADEVARTRVVYLTGEASIPVAALLAIAGALFFHLLIVGAFFLALYLTVRPIAPAGNASLSDAGSAGSGAGYMVAGDAPDGPPVLAGDVETILGHTALAPSPEAPTLPPAPDDFANGSHLSSLAASDSPPEIIGIASGSDHFGNLRPPPPPPHLRKTPNFPNNTMIVLPPVKEAPPSSATLLASAGNKGAIAASPHGGIGDGGDADYGDEAIIPLSKADLGTGGQNGRGGSGGLDRGGSGANNPEPMLLDYSMPDFSMADQLNPPDQATKFRVTVKADGKPGKIEIVQSCGRKDIDATFLTMLEHARYRPAYRDGRPYEAAIPLDFGLNGHKK